MSEPIKYVITDDHALFRDGVKAALASVKGIINVGEAADGNELLRLLERKEVDVVLLDLKMPEKDGIEVLKELRPLYPGLKVIILTMYTDDEYVIHMLDNGANGYLVKNTAPEEIELAIKTVQDNDYYFNEHTSKALLSKVVKKKTVVPQFKDADLNDREKEILKLICAELTNAEIAEKVYLSTRTVEGIRAGMLEKIGARNTAGLVLYAAKKGIA